MVNSEELSEIEQTRSFFLSARFAGLCGLIGPLIAFIGIAVAIVLAPWFNWFDHALSDLGHPWMLGGSNGIPGINASAPLFNTSLVIAGLFTLVLTIWLIRYQYFERSAIGLIAAILLTVAQFFLIAIGVFHEAFGTIHFAVSVGFFVTLLFAGMIYGIRLMQEKPTQIFGVLAFVLALISAIIWVAYYTIPLPFTGQAIPEIISAVTAFIWVFPLCIRLVLKMK
ncbi:MAG: DUF998 domain-containing protein [Promethearchaeota archaeon]